MKENSQKVNDHSQKVKTEASQKKVNNKEGQPDSTLNTIKDNRKIAPLKIISLNIDTDIISNDSILNWFKNEYKTLVDVPIDISYNRSNKWMKPKSPIPQEVIDHLFKADDQWLIEPTLSPPSIEYPYTEESEHDFRYAPRIITSGDYFLFLIYLENRPGNVIKIFLVSLSPNGKMMGHETVYLWKDMYRAIESEIDENYLLTIGERRLIDKESLKFQHLLKKYQISDIGEFKLISEDVKELLYSDFAIGFETSPLER